MKPLLFFSALLFIYSCNNNGSGSNSGKKMYGAPKAVVTNTPDTGTQKGPLAYAPNVPHCKTTIRLK
jgi:hypothetical protein